MAGRPQFEVGRAYTGELLRFNLPMRQYRACDFYGFGIWCRYASQLFTNITWNSDIFVSDSDNLIMTFPDGNILLTLCFK